jgi:guanylate kinase
MTARLFVISAPSGAGKTSLVRALRERLPGLAVSVSHTTRKPRPNEQHGREYYFVEPHEFQRMVDEDAFLEHAHVFGNRYGTGRDQVREKLDAGSDVVLEIDWQGAAQVRQRMPECHSIFILPPSREALRQRLTARQTDSQEVIERRLAEAVADMSRYPEFDYVVVNDDFDKALEELTKIVAGEGGELHSRRPGLAPLVRNLLEFPTP